jgi:glutamine amidotransferase
MQKVITIVDYGMGNIHSLKNAFYQIGARVNVTSDPEEIRKADVIILPGVGSYGQAVSNIKKFDLKEAIIESGVKRAIPFLGICLGMQLLSSRGEEDGLNDGLNFIDGEVLKMKNDNVRLPHIGFNQAEIIYDRKGIFSNINNNSDFYFVHSYKFVCKHEQNILSTTTYGEKFISSVQKDNIFGFQFHPEKSQSNGLQLLNNFVKIASKI